MARIIEKENQERKELEEQKRKNIIQMIASFRLEKF